MNRLENFHIITVKYSGPTNTRGSRIVLRSDRFKTTKSIPYNYDYNNTLEGAQRWLTDNGFELFGQAEGKDCYYIISETFEPLKENKQHPVIGDLDANGNMI